MSNKPNNQWVALIMVLITVWSVMTLYRYFNKEKYKEYMEVGPTLDKQIDCTFKRDMGSNYIKNNISLGNAKIPSAKYFEAMDSR